jgi:6-phosphogluconolactonase
VIDLGIDQARFYRKDGKSLTLIQALALPGGSGPRHVVYTKDGLRGWIVTELSNEIYAISYDKQWTITGKYSTLPSDYTGRSACAAIRLSNDGKLLAASNRGHESVAIFEVGDASGASDAGGASGALILRGIFPLGGKHPRDIFFSPDDKWLLSANQESDLVTVLSVNDGFAIVDGAAISISKPTGLLI